MTEPGIKYRVNPLFLIVLIVFSLAGILKEILIIFFIVLLHETSHIITAKILGYRIHSFEIFPFGGIVEYRGLVELEPRDEIVIALAGPLFNFGFALVLFVAGYLLDYRAFFWPEMMIKFNLILGSFNLIPALPLDGGRVLRSILVSKMGLKAGNLIAVKIARSLAMTGIIVGFAALLLQKSNLWILLVSFFVYGAVIKESQGIIYRLTFYLTSRKEYLSKKDFRTVVKRVVKGSVRVREAVHYLLPVYFNIFIILDDNLKIRAEITEVELLEAFFSFPDKNMTLDDIID